MLAAADSGDVFGFPGAALAEVTEVMGSHTRSGAKCKIPRFPIIFLKQPKIMTGKSLLND